jgi:phosphatidylinositol alpha-1,6-mannosyltransferase
MLPTLLLAGWPPVSAGRPGCWGAHARFAPAAVARFLLLLAFSDSAWQTQRVLIGLFPELDAAGGVQRAGRHIAAVMKEFADSRGMECRFLSLNDSRELHRMSVGEREFVFTGAERAKARFTATAVRAARRRAKLVVAAHVNLAPVVRAMHVAAPRMTSIICSHGVEVWEPLPLLRRRALRKATLILAPSQSTADYLAAMQKIPAGRIRVLPWALDPQFEAMVAQPRAPLPANFPRGPVIFTVGRWLASERYKGMDTLITALPRLLTRWPALQLVLAGEGDDRAWLEDLAQRNGVTLHVHFVSKLSYAELASCYAACDVFALPSSGEGFGLVYLEAMAFGKPVIGGAHGGAPEVIQDGLTGYLVQHGDASQLATCIETFLADPALARKMGERGRERVASEFRFNVFAKSLKKILREQCES